MNLRQDFLEIVKEIKANTSKDLKITTRDFLSYFGYEKRTKGNNARIDDYLNKNNLETEPYYVNPRSCANPFAFDKFVIRYLRDAETSSA